MKPIILTLTGAQLAVVLDALSEHVIRSERRGDAGPDVANAHAVIDQALHMQFIETETSRQALLAIGLGVARGRGQG